MNRDAQNKFLVERLGCGDWCDHSVGYCRVIRAQREVFPNFFAPGVAMNLLIADMKSLKWFVRAGRPGDDEKEIVFFQCLEAHGDDHQSYGCIGSQGSLSEAVANAALIALGWDSANGNWESDMTDNYKKEQIEEEKRRLYAAMDRFLTSCLEKLNDKAEHGVRGWDDPACLPGLRVALGGHMVRAMTDPAQYIDVANIAMMLHRLEERE